MGYNRNVCGMNLSVTMTGWKGDHPFGSTVSFNSYDNIRRTKAGKKVVKKKWIWSYEGADSSDHDSLTKAVEDWRSVMGLPLSRKKESVK